MSKEKLSGADALMRSLQEEEVDLIFGYPGGATPQQPGSRRVAGNRGALGHLLATTVLNGKTAYVEGPQIIKLRPGTGMP